MTHRLAIRKTAIAVCAGLLAAGVTSAPAQAQNIGSGIIIDDVDLEGVNIVEGVLTATGGTVSGTISGLPFTTDIENFRLEFEPDGMEGCSILDLELGPIDLDLLGLHVDTSPICLNITGFEGEGLLGDLLCGLSGLLDDLLGDLLDLDDLTDLLEDILSEVLTEALHEAGDPPSGAEDICDGECEVLDLAVGPVDLTLLGLNVHLDDCDNGPVQVCLSASEGQGLLGDLLCGLTGDGILPDLGAIEDLVDVLEDLADAELTDRQTNRLVRVVGKTLRDGELSNRELNKIEKEVDKLLR
ncbi:MAG TPA: hypothetical protein VJ828_13455 [Lacipirellulaceae bacterium]|nr:hypothetical protein [Lacipirellulaceae bacterium]